ncbi:MAG: hypothetical protein FWF98_02235 [Dehalococcoidia bacterium]|nr:hypothetical protein [Dehalococcoidia bacterium]
MKKVLSLMLVLILALSLMTACGENSGGSNTVSSSPTTDNSGNNLPPNTKVIKVGKTFEKYGIKITLDEVWVSTYTKNNPARLPEGHVFLFPHFTITNTNEGYKDMKDTSITRLAFSSIGGCIAYIGGDEYKRTMDALMSYGGSAIQMDTYVNYNEAKKVFNAFIVPENWETVEFVVNHMMPDSVVNERLDFKYSVENK